MPDEMTAAEYVARFGQPSGVDPLKRGEHLEQQVIDYAELNGWEVMQIPNFLARLAFGPRRCGYCGKTAPVRAVKGGRRTRTKGWPDLVLAYDEDDGTTTILFRELKAGSGALRKEQREWGTRLKRAGMDWSVWTDTPECWLEIQQALKRRRKASPSKPPTGSPKASSSRAARKPSSGSARRTSPT